MRSLIKPDPGMAVAYIDYSSMEFLIAAVLSDGHCGGGNTMFNVERHQIFTANITPDEKTGIGTWTEDDFGRAMKESKRKDGKALRYPMMAYNSLTDAEIKAIWTYLRSIPSLCNEVDRQWDKDI